MPTPHDKKHFTRRPLISWRSFACVVGLAVLDVLSACGEGSTPDVTAPVCTVGATRCAELQQEICTDGSAWSTATDCQGDQRCRAGACADPSATALQQVQAAADYAQTLADNTGWELPLDVMAMKAAAKRLIIDAGDGNAATYYAALYGILSSDPEGHQGLSNGKCNTPEMYSQQASRFGVCGVPLGDHIVVTYAEKNNPLGLTAGDEITTAGSDTGPALLAAANRRPVCGDHAPSEAGQRMFAAESFFGTVPAGMVLTIQAGAGGAVRQATVPTTSGHEISCQDPLGRSIAFNASSYVRPDGVAVIRIPRFYPIGATLPDNATPEQVQKLIDDFQASIQVEFDKVKSAPTIIWDARGNGGGITAVGLAIVAGMPTAKATDLSYCVQRNAMSSPPAFDTARYAAYSVAPGGPFAYTGKVAVIIDGADYSAADYFAMAVARATSVPLIGSPTSGAFGGPGPAFDLKATPKVSAFFDSNHCVDAATGAALDTHAVMPTFPTDYAPADLANGVDTLLEAAVAHAK